MENLVTKIENQIKGLQVEIDEMTKAEIKRIAEQELILHKLTLCQLENIKALNRKEGNK